MHAQHDIGSGDRPTWWCKRCLAEVVGFFSAISQGRHVLQSIEHRPCCCKCVAICRPITCHIRSVYTMLKEKSQ